MFGKTDSNLHPIKFSVKIHHDTEEIVKTVDDSFDNLNSVREGQIEERKFVNLTNPTDSTAKNVDLNLEKDQQSIILKNSDMKKCLGKKSAIIYVPSVTLNHRCLGRKSDIIYVPSVILHHLCLGKKKSVIIYEPSVTLNQKKKHVFKQLSCLIWNGLEYPGMI